MLGETSRSSHLPDGFIVASIPQPTTATVQRHCSLDAVLGVAINAADNPLISYLKCVRLNQDTVELSYITADAISTSTSFIDVLTN
jgi:hypothetical protein